MTAATPLPLPRPAPPLSVAALKRLDCLGFTRRFPADERARWDDWATRLWRADELAEKNRWAFQAQRDEWESARDIGPPGIRRIADAWSRYLAALADYHRPGLVIRTLAEHDEMLLRLSGPLMQLAPGMPDELWDAAAAFGALDQFYNNLRDLAEDAARGLCLLPADVLREHGLTREDVIAGRAPDKVEWRRFLLTWLDDYRWQLYGESLNQLARCADPSIDAMVDWTILRYARIERVLRDVRFDYRRFGDVYWEQVRRELGESAGGMA